MIHMWFSNIHHPYYYSCKDYPSPLDKACIIGNLDSLDATLEDAKDALFELENMGYKVKELDEYEFAVESSPYDLIVVYPLYAEGGGIELRHTVITFDRPMKFEEKIKIFEKFMKNNEEIDMLLFQPTETRYEYEAVIEHNKVRILSIRKLEDVLKSEEYNI